VEDPLPGYEGKLRELLESKGARVGCRIRITRFGGREIIEGLLMPKHAFSSPYVVVLKLDNGYNIGVEVREDTSIEVLECRTPPKAMRIKLAPRPELPYVKVIGTGGTIASKVEYETGAVKPSMSPEDLVELIPELMDVANIDSEVLFNILSENMTPYHWQVLAERIAKLITNESFKGFVVAHGTDTMSYTAAALAFALQKLPCPIVLVGAQRSSDRPSTDAALNFLSAVLTAVHAPFGEVVVCMHATPSDTLSLVHRGVKVRKMHSSRRDAFQSINDLPLAKVDPISKKFEIINKRFIPRASKDELVVKPKFDDRVALIKAYPGFQAEIIDMLVDRGFHGIVIEGTGLGHIAENVIPSIKRAIESGVAVVMTTQTLFGRINMNVYTTGRKLLQVGVIPGEDMLPEVAYVKLSWVLAQTRDLNEVKRMMLHNYVNEINYVHTLELYPRWIEL